MCIKTIFYQKPNSSVLYAQIIIKTMTIFKISISGQLFAYPDLTCVWPVGMFFSSTYHLSYLSSYPFILYPLSHHSSIPSVTLFPHVRSLSCSFNMNKFIKPLMFENLTTVLHETHRRYEINKNSTVYASLGARRQSTKC